MKPKTVLSTPLLALAISLGSHPALAQSWTLSSVHLGLDQDDEPTAAPAPQLPDLPYPAHEDSIVTESGLEYSYLKHGDGEDLVRVGDRLHWHYTVWTPDGLRIDGTRDPERIGDVVEPRVIGLGDPDQSLMRGMEEALQLMRAGDQVRLTIPYHLAYGERGSASMNVPPKTDLIFEVEVVKIVVRTLDYEKWSRGGATETESGLKYKVLEAGDGIPCKEATLVYVDYAVWTVDGQLINSSGVKGRPFVVAPDQFPLPFLNEAMGMMRNGDRWLFHVPSEIAFGERPMRKLPPGASSIWQLACRQAWDLHEPAFQLPPHEELTVTKSGLGYKVLREGTGFVPDPTGRVRLHHVGWLADGTRFDSSYARKRESTFALQQVIPAWAEALPMMKEGAHVLLVVPPELAYGADGFKPYRIPADATLVYAIELIQAL